MRTVARFLEFARMHLYWVGQLHSLTLLPEVFGTK